MSRAGITDIDVSFDASGHLVFESEKSTGKAYIRILDATAQSETDRLSNRFGIAGGTFYGEDPEDKAGIAERLYTQLREATGVTGYISQRVSFGGTYGQGTIFDEIVEIQDQIQRIEERVARREEQLRRRFINMEQAVARLQQQQSAILRFVQAAENIQSPFSNR